MKHYPSLSLREAEVASLAAIGLSDQEVADRLDLRLATVTSYWARIRGKLHAENKVHAISIIAQQAPPGDRGWTPAEGVGSRLADATESTGLSENILVNQAVVELLDRLESEAESRRFRKSS